MYGEDAHLESAYEQRYEFDADWNSERDYAEETDNRNIDRDDEGLDFPDAVLALTGDDMDQDDQGVPLPAWLL